MTASWLTADLAADSSLLRALDADGGSSMGLLPAPSLLGGVFGLENSWTMGLPRTSAGDPPAERGPVSFRGIAARLGVGEQHRQESALQVQSITGGEQAAGATQSEPARWAPGSLVRTRLQSGCSIAMPVRNHIQCTCSQNLETGLHGNHCMSADLQHVLVRRSLIMRGMHMHNVRRSLQSPLTVRLPSWQAPLPWVPQLPTSAAGPLPITMAHPHSSSGQLHAAAPVTVSAARQAILARLQHVLSNPPPPRHGGGETGSNRDPPQAPLLPATLLSEAVAYPSLVTAAVQRSQAPQQQQQPQQTGALPPSSAVRERTSPAVSATAASQHQGSQQTISKQPETAGVAIIGRPRPPAQPAARAAPSTDLPAAVRSACAACDGAAQHAASADRSMMPTYRLTVPSAERRAQPEPPVAAAAWQAPPHPVTLPSAPQDAGAASGEETEDEAPPPPVKRMRRTTAAAAAAAAAAHREDYVKASECAPRPCALSPVARLTTPCIKRLTSPTPRLTRGHVMQYLQRTTLWVCALSPSKNADKHNSFRKH